MKLHVIEASNGFNWGKFAVGRPDEEWKWRSEVSDVSLPLLREVGWDHKHIFVIDLQTGEGARFLPDGIAKYDLDKHQIHVCPLFEPFLTWLYDQNLTDLDALPTTITLDAPGALYGYRRPGLSDTEIERETEETSGA